MQIRYGVLLILVALVSSAVRAGLSEGRAAYERGDHATALAELRPLAEQGNAVAQNLLATMYTRGQGVARDLVEAARWYRKAADQGQVYAQYSLGLAHAEGDGVARDAVEAARWLLKAARGGNANAQFEIGRRYEEGEGVAKDEPEAAKRQAATRSGDGPSPCS